MAAAPVFTGGSNLMVFEVRRLKGFGWQCCLCLNSAVSLQLVGRGLPFLLHWFRGQGAQPQRIQSSRCGQEVSPESPGLLGLPVSSLTGEAGLRMT